MFCKKSRMFVCLSALAMIAALAAGTVNAGIIGTYVDADMSNTTPASAITTLASGGWVTDNLWTFPYSDSGGEGGSVFLSFGAANESSPTLTTTVSVPNGTYDVSLVYWQNNTSSRPGIKAAITGNSLVSYGASGTLTGNPGGSGIYDERQVSLGSVVVSGGSFSVQIGDSYGSSINPSTHYDGIAYTVVPEPGTLVLLATGLIGLLCYAWRKRK